MTNLQLWIAVALPIIAVLASLTVSLIQISGVRDEMREIRSDMRALRGEVHADLIDIRGDIKLLTGKVYEMMGHKEG